MFRGIKEGKWFGLFIMFFLGVNLYEVQGQSQDWKNLIDNFEKDYKNLNISSIQLSFVDNLKLIKNKDSVLQQEALFNLLGEQLKSIDLTTLTNKQLIDYDVLCYEYDLNRERISLEKKWLNAKKQITADRIYDVAYGKEWYAYFLKKWVDVAAHPDSIYNLGLEEIKKVKFKMKAIQLQSGLDSLGFKKHINDSIFYYTNVEEVQKAFEEMKKTVSEKLPTMFPQVEKIPNLKIAQGTNKQLAQVPGFYRNETVFYNYFDKAYNKRQVGWLYLHEGMPGHHYHIMHERILEKSSIRYLFGYRGVGEGWAAYIEELGKELGAYATIYDELGKWEWDIIRSVRVALDVGLNYYGWSDEKALEFWQQHIQDQDEIALREIARMKRWPAQVITYKYGSDKILRWKAVAEKNENFSQLKFHTNILKNGILPYTILEKHLFKKNK